MTHVVSANEFYAVQIAKVDLIASLNEELNRACREQSSAHCYLPEVNTVCAVLWENQWLRGRVASRPQEGSFDVVLVDSGVTVRSKWSLTQEIEQRFLQQPEFVLRCSLSGVVASESAEANEMFIKMSGTKAVTMRVDNCFMDGSYEVTLSEDRNLDKSINQMIIEKISRAKGTQKLRNISGNTSDHNKWNVSVTHCVSPNEFYIRLEADEDDYRHLSVDIQEQLDACNAVMSTSLSWKKNDKCYVRTATSFCDQVLWYRGLIMHVETGKFVVQLRDIGSCVTISSAFGLTHPVPSLEKLDEFATKCHLSYIMPADSLDWSLTAVDKFQQLIKKSSQLAITLPEVGHITASVPVVLWSMKKSQGGPFDPERIECTNINDNLRSLGLGKSIVDVRELGNHFVEHPSALKRSSSRGSDESANLKGGTWLPPRLLDKLTFECVPTYISPSMEINLYDKTDGAIIRHMKKTYAKKANESMEELDEFVAISGQWHPNEPCMAKYWDSYFYRAIIKEIDHETGKCKVSEC